MSCPRIWNIEKEKVGDRPAKLNEKKSDRGLEREIKDKGDIFFVGRATKKFCTGGEKMRNASGTKMKMSGSEKKKVNKNTYDVSSIKRITRKFLDVSRCSSAKQRQRNVQKSVLLEQSCFFVN